MSELAESAQCCATQADAGAVVAPAGIHFHHIDLGAAPPQLDGRRHAGEAAADDQMRRATDAMEGLVPFSPPRIQCSGCAPAQCLRYPVGDVVTRR